MRMLTNPARLFRLLRATVMAAATILPAVGGAAQNAPLISGGLGFFTNTTGGNTKYFPYGKPVLVAPLGSHLTVETRATLVETFFPKGNEGYQHSFFKTMDYLQADV